MKDFSSFILPPSSFIYGGGVWESNPPEPALTVSQTVLKTAPDTSRDAPPFLRQEKKLRAQLEICQEQIKSGANKFSLNQECKRDFEIVID
jgi:hypothetical protein